MITVLKNDGTKTYEHSHEDGEHHASSMEIGMLYVVLRLGCYRVHLILRSKKPIIL